MLAPSFLSYSLALLSYPLALTPLLLSLLLLPSCSPSLPIFLCSLSPCGHDWPLLLYSFPSLCLSTINALKPWTASSHRDSKCWSNGAGLPLTSCVSNLQQEDSLSFQTPLLPIQAVTKQDQDSLPSRNQPELSPPCPFPFGLGQSPPLGPHCVLSSSETQRHPRARTCSLCRPGDSEWFVGTPDCGKTHWFTS